MLHAFYLVLCLWLRVPLAFQGRHCFKLRPSVTHRQGLSAFEVDDVPRLKTVLTQPYDVRRRKFPAADSRLVLTSTAGVCWFTTPQLEVA